MVDLYNFIIMYQHDLNLIRDIRVDFLSDTQSRYELNTTLMG
jgi:hypothetical protein